jgi:hypothetical protein
MPRNLLMWQRRESIIDVYQMALGLFLFLSPWLLAYKGNAGKLDAWASGLAIALTSIVGLITFCEWEEWLNCLLGLWLVSSPWTLNLSDRAAIHLVVGVGTVVVYLTLLDLWLIHFLPHTNRSLKG